MLLSCFDFQLILRRFYNDSNTTCELRCWSRCSSFCRVAKRYRRPDRFRHSGPLTIPLLPKFFADLVGSPNVTCVRSNRFGSSQTSLLCILPFRETLRGCSQRVSGDRFARQLSRAPLLGPLECHQTQHT